jgi:hypothetical protein
MTEWGDPWGKSNSPARIGGIHGFFRLASGITGGGQFALATEFYRWSKRDLTELCLNKIVLLDALAELMEGGTEHILVRTQSSLTQPLIACKINRAAICSNWSCAHPIFTENCT